MHFWGEPELKQNYLPCHKPSCFKIRLIMLALVEKNSVNKSIFCLSVRRFIFSPRVQVCVLQIYPGSGFTFSPLFVRKTVYKRKSFAFDNPITKLQSRAHPGLYYYKWKTLSCLHLLLPLLSFFLSPPTSSLATPSPLTHFFSEYNFS